MGESRRRKIADPNYGKTFKVKLNFNEIEVEFIRFSSIASCLQYFIEISVNVPADVKPYEPYILSMLEIRANELKKVNESTIKEILDAHGHNKECQSTFLVLGLSAVCNGLFAYINDLIKAFPSVSDLIKSLNKTDVEKIASNTEKYHKQQCLWLDIFSSM